MSGIIDTLFWNETLQPYLDEQVKKAHPNQDAKKQDGGLIVQRGV